MVSLIAATATAAAAEIGNPSFETADGQRPARWTGAGTATWDEGEAPDGRRFVTIGRGGAWVSEPVRFEAGAAYELRFRVRYRPAKKRGGVAFLGPEFAPQSVALDGGGDAPVWKTQAIRFVAPTEAGQAGRLGYESCPVRLGEWELEGQLDYDALELRRLQVVHHTASGVTLGEGEQVRGIRYTFEAPLGTWRNISRPLQAWATRFHDNRWHFSPEGSEVLYRHEVAGCEQQNATLTLGTWFAWESTLRLRVDASTDGKTFQEVAVVTDNGSRDYDRALTVDLPKGLFPARTVWVRLRTEPTTDAKAGTIQCPRYSYTADLNGPPRQLVGSSTAWSLLGQDAGLEVAVEGWNPHEPVFHATVGNTRTQAVNLAPAITVRRDGNSPHEFAGSPVTLAAGTHTRLEIPFALAEAGRNTVAFRLGPALQTHLAAEVRVPILHVSGYGQSLPSPDPAVGVWWASSGWKISRTRPAPQAQGDAVTVRLAGNETEAAQLVVRPDRPLNGLTATVSDLRSAAGHVLPSSAVEILCVRYVPVEIASDDLGSVGDWPDPLPPLGAGVSVAARQNQPLWLRVRTPRDARPGVYRGTVALRADGFQADVPLDVEVYGFALPETATCRSMFGFNPGTVFRYHGVRSDADKRTVLDKYLRSFSNHRISPYNPAPLDGFTYQWPRESEWDGAARLARGEAHGGSQSLRSEDASTKENPQMVYRHPLVLSGRPLKIGLWYKTAQDNPSAFIYVSFLDSHGNHLAGQNAHLELPGSRSWRQFEHTLTQFPVGAKTAMLSIQGAPWSEQGEAVGSVWVDDVSVRDAGSGEEFIRGGGFEASRPLSEAVAAGVQFDWSAWDAAMERAFREYHFNSFIIGVPGLGGGTFYERYEGSLCGYAADTPEYQALFQAWCSAARLHLAEKGWLDEAVTYPFDEPDVKDYAFVVEQLRRLKKAFPSLRRMVPMNLGAAQEFVGWVDCWCPILHSHRREFADERRRAGDVYAWYICCGPESPYVANFIDRPATDLRVWLWQTWQERVQGVLIWESVWWHSPEAYPDSLQNPYEDSMSWVSGYGTPRGQKRPWNAGDGRFLYPPETATGRQPQPVLDGPVDSIRWEALRDGIEDYEYHALLERLLAGQRGKLPAGELARYEALLQVPAEISQSLTHYTTDPAPLEARRHELAQAIQPLGTGLVPP
jgi:hypothetical protein